MGPLGPMGFRRRGRRRGLVVGTAVGAGVARSSQRRADQAMAANSQPTQQDVVNDQIAPQAVAPSIDDQFAEIEKLGELKEKGLITQTEFDAKKTQILGL